MKIWLPRHKLTELVLGASITLIGAMCGSKLEIHLFEKHTPCDHSHSSIETLVKEQ
jgi:hypothetical protein